MNALQAAVEALTPEFAHAAIGMSRPGGQDVYAISSAQRRAPLTPDTFFRAASISKIVTGQTCLAVFRTLPDGLATPASTLFGDSLFEGVPGVPALGQLLSHTSGLWDDGGYAIPPGERLDDWLAANRSAIWSDSAPGQIMRYCNLGYILAAAAAERIADRDFDDLARAEVLGPYGIEAGFNWAGLAATARDMRVPIYRRMPNGAFLPQIDADVAPDGISGLDGHQVPRERGGVAHRLSPQGGLRISLRGALALGRCIPVMTQDRLHHFGDCQADDPTGLMQDYGAGLMFLDRPDLYPRPLVGHFANAYGFAGGVWHDPECATTFAYALNGLPDGDTSDALRPAEWAVFAAVATALD